MVIMLCTYTHAHTRVPMHAYTRTYPCTHAHTHVPTHTQEVVGIHAAQEAEEQLLYLARHGQQKRREGPRGDPAEAAARKEHIEL